MNAELLIQLLSQQQPRRLRVIENLFTGRKTVSTLYWGMRYQLLEWLNFDKRLTRQQMDQVVSELTTAGLIETQDSLALLTPNGQKKQQMLRETWYQPEAKRDWLLFDGQAGLERLLLAVQTVSELKAQNHGYYPVQVNWTNRVAVKNWYRQHRQLNLAQNLRAELTLFLAQQPSPVADQWAALLVGHEQTGTTLEQLAQLANRSTCEMQILIRDVTVALMVYALNAINKAPLLAHLLDDLKQSPVSTSAQTTLNDFRAGLSLPQIGQRRRLKLSTVNEHLLEAAILLPRDAFPYEQLLPDSLQQALQEVLTKPIDDWRFNELTGLNVEFWQFRLYEILRSKTEDDNGH